ncbi:hypothetical protein F5890DRAFT_1483704 [Lentinula detonsa]|uniref:Secreted protein n=1 Tax=Lentinula detonsa TaxID=2804962 RepID=A0AA38UY58_9AGAR|nr:hypothetical protein F5890DRAFT_1483704 [Lentinula detonsa]
MLIRFWPCLFLLFYATSTATVLASTISTNLELSYYLFIIMLALVQNYFKFFSGCYPISLRYIHDEISQKALDKKFRKRCPLLYYLLFAAPNLVKPRPFDQHKLRSFPPN